MSDLTVSQKLINIIGSEWEDEITITNVPPKQFPAVIEMTYDENNNTRTIEVALLDLETSQGGTMTTNSGMYVRAEGEEYVTASCQTTNNTVGYPS